MEELSGWDRETSPFHRGEQELQARLGLAEKMESLGKIIMRPYLPQQHQAFFAQLPFFVVGSVDDQGAPWASLLFGKPGFVSSPDVKHLHIASMPAIGDPLATNITPGAPVSFLGIEPPTRRRNRVNATVESVSDNHMQFGVDMSFGNCPQYIQTRDIEFIRDPDQQLDGSANEAFTALDAEAVNTIRTADTFFVSSVNPQDDQHDTGGVDVNHRGGKPGFVKIDGNTLTIPDYMGNFIFNTLGNFLLNPKAGITFVDFESGDLLLLTGTTEILWDEDPVVKAFRGAERAWRFTLTHGLRLKGASPVRWKFGEYSPNTKLTGTWNEAQKTIDAESEREAWCSYRIIRIHDESSLIRSIYLEREKKDALLPFVPGQFLTIRTNQQAHDKPLIRTYTLSSAPSDSLYRISVKRESGDNIKVAPGLVSTHIHDQWRVGTLIQAKSPRGVFTLDTAQTRPALLLAGGVGITPMISMARQVANEGVRTRNLRPLTVLHVSQTIAQRVFAKEFTDLQSTSNNAIRYRSLISQPETGEVQHRDYHLQGYITADLLKSLLPLDDYDVYLCGPPAFMQSSYKIVRQLGIADARIHAESFGAARLTRDTDANTITTYRSNKSLDAEVASTAIVSFTQSQFEQPWTPEAGTLLELAEQHGLSPKFACRNGVCGSCLVKIKSGGVAYRTEPLFEHADDEALICCAVPSKGDKPLVLDM